MGFDEALDLHSIRDEQSFSHKFFHEVPNLDSQEFDFYVIDVSAVYSIARNRKYTSDLFANKDLAETLENQLSDYRTTKKDRNGQEVLQYKSTPYSRAKTFERIDQELYVPDITEDCITNPESEISNAEGLLEYLEKETYSLPVREVMGISEYSTKDLKNAESLNEDDAIVEAAKNLEGNFCILTYDSDFLNKEINASIPEFILDTKIDNTF